MSKNNPVECYIRGKYLGQYLSVLDYITFEPVMGATIYEVARASLLIARRHQIRVFVAFNNINMSVPYEMWPNTNTNVSDIVDDYYNRAWQRHMKYNNQRV